MKSRRGTNFWPGSLGHMVDQYRPGDIVVATIVEDDSFTGVVREVHRKLNKVVVAWSGGSVVQHDPDEIMLHPYNFAVLKERLDRNFEASVKPRRMKNASVDMFSCAEFVERFQQLYNQFYLFHWQTYSRPQHISFEEANDDLSDMMDKFVEAYQGKYGRVEIEQTLPLANYDEIDEVEFCEDYRDYLVGAKQDVIDEDDLAAIIDEMIARMNKLLYLLTLGGDKE